MKETSLKIRVFPDPVLRRKSKPVVKINDRHRELLSAMAQLMYEGQGIGLAATQAGLDEALIVVDAGSGLYKLINPRIISRAGSQSMEEGCLSVPGVCIKIKRAKKIKVAALDESGFPLRIDAEDLFACVLQHEIDHLKGKLIIDHFSLFQKIKIKKKLEQLKQMFKDEKQSNSETKSCKLQL